MDDSSTDEQEFPGLYEMGKKNVDENESNSSENIDKKTSKKDKKDKSDRQSYEALGADSEDDAESKLFRSPSKSKKSKFKFPTSSTKKQREKSREPDVKDTPDGKDKKLKEKLKDHKDKDKKEKKKEKSKASGAVSESFDGDVLPVFGISLGLAVERSKCHDGVKLPLVVRNCIDFLQENLNSDQLYKAEGVKSRIQHLKKCYNNRDPITEEMDVPTASSLLKTYISELSEPILTTELIARFEEVSAVPDVTTQAKEFSLLIDQLPKVNQVLLAWVTRHLSAVINHGKSNKLNAQSLAVLLSPILQMSHRLLIALLCHGDLLFADVHLKKYVPPINASSPNLPEAIEDIQLELRKQESLLSQIHSEMNAGLHSKKREEELWETQRIITQLKRKLRTFEKKQDSMQKSMDTEAMEEAIDFTLRKPVEEDEETAAVVESAKDSENVSSHAVENIDKVYVAENGLFMLPKEHPDYQTLIRLQLENQELMNWKQQLQSRINTERAECVRLKKVLDTQPPSNSESGSNLTAEDPEYERLVEHYLKENSLLEQKKLLLQKEIFDENLSLIQMQVELTMKQLVH